MVSGFYEKIRVSYDPTHTSVTCYARGGKYQVETISLSDFVRDTLPLLTSGLIPTVNIQTDLPDDVLKARADLIQLQMVLLAIMSNASEALEEEGMHSNYLPK